MESPCIIPILQSSTNITENFDSCQSVLIEELSDESTQILQIDGWPKTTLIVVLIVCIILNTFGKVFMVYYITERAPTRPLNDMILIDQSVQTLPSLIHGILVTFSIAVNQPLAHFIGKIGCFSMQVNVLFHQVVIVVGGAGMALFRLISYLFINQIQNINNVKRFILLTAYSLVGLLLVLFIVAGHFMDSGYTLDLCQGMTQEMSQILAAYDNEFTENFELGKNLHNVAHILCVLTILFEFACYCVIMIKVFYYDKKLSNEKIIDLKAMKERNKKNAITLTGQCLTFILEITYGIVTLILRNYQGYGILNYTSFPVFAIIGWTLVTMVQIGTSPEIRRFLRRTKVDVLIQNDNISQLINALKIEEPIEPNNDIEMKEI